MEFLTQTVTTETPSSGFIEDLMNGRLFLQCPLREALLPKCFLEYLQKSFPSLQPAPDQFAAHFQLFDIYLRNGDLRNFPACPPALDNNQQDVWHFLCTVVLHYRKHFQTILSRIPSHGEVWQMTHLWAPLLERALLYSDLITLDRMELQHPVVLLTPEPSKKVAYGGILRPVHTHHNPSHRVAIGFAEDKPLRVPYAKDSAKDREKVLSALEHGIIHLWRHGVPPKSMRKILLIGLICNGN